jgi:hypothetical protein
MFKDRIKDDISKSGTFCVKLFWKPSKCNSFRKPNQGSLFSNVNHNTPPPLFFGQNYIFCFSAMNPWYAYIYPSRTASAFVFEKMLSFNCNFDLLFHPFIQHFPSVASSFSYIPNDMGGGGGERELGRYFFKLSGALKLGFINFI